MPSSLHETLIEMFRTRPSLAPELLTGALDVDVPKFDQARLESGDLPELIPTEYRADAVVVLSEADLAVLAVVVEVQLNRKPDKRWSWPVYLATLRARWKCPTAVLVVCHDDAVARWCATPIDLGPGGSRVVPLVVGPDMVPVITDVEQVGGSPELMVLSALAHGGEPQHYAILNALTRALRTVEEEHRFLYLGLVHAVLPAAAREYLEEIMSIQTDQEHSSLAKWYMAYGAERAKDQFKAEGKAEGKAESKAESVLSLLELRGVTVPEDVRTRITSCADLGQLQVWFTRAVQASTIEDVVD